MGKQGIRALLILGVLGVLAFLVSGPRTSHADDDSSGEPDRFLERHAKNAGFIRGAAQSHQFFAGRQRR